MISFKQLAAGMVYEHDGDRVKTIKVSWVERKILQRVLRRLAGA